MENKKKNIRLYPIYKMCSWDLLFYYAIAYIFLVQTKGFTPAEVMLTDATYPVFKIIWNIPCTIIVDNLGKRKSLILGNIILSLSLITLLFSNNIGMVIFTYCIMAFAFAIKNLTESNLLFDSVVREKNEKSKRLFSKLEELGARNYYFLDGISSFATGFLFIINGYIPIIVSLGFTVIATALSTCFKEIENKENDDFTNENRFLSYFKELKQGFKCIIKSKRLQALMLFIFIFDGTIYVSYTLRETLLNDLKIAPQYFAAILSGLTVISGVFASLQEKIHTRFRNRALTFIALIYLPTFILVGFIFTLNINWYLKILITLVIFAVQYAMQAPYYTLISTYTKNFSSFEMRTKISSAATLVTSISQSLMAAIASGCLEKISANKTFIILGFVISFIICSILTWMKGKVGLKPEDYDKNDVFNEAEK